MIGLKSYTPKKEWDLMVERFDEADMAEEKAIW